MQGRAWGDSGAVLHDSHSSSCCPWLGLCCRQPWCGGHRRLGTGPAPSTGASLPGQVHGTFLRRSTKAVPEQKNRCQRQLGRSSEGGSACHRFQTVQCNLSLHTPGFHCCCGAGWWMGENKSVTSQCVKFISAYFSHAHVHMHAR